MGIVKTFKEYVNEEWYKGPESYYRLQKLYRDDPSFRRNVDNGTIGVEVGAEERYRAMCRKCYKNAIH